MTRHSPNQPLSSSDSTAARKRILVAVIAALLAGIDLAAKALAESKLAASSVDLAVIQLRLSHNSGVAFSMGDRLPTWMVIALTAAITTALGAYAWRAAATAGPVRLAAGAAIIAGAVANLADRTADGMVTDYLHTGWFPTFNLADTFLTVGVTVLIAAELFTSRRADTSPDTITDHTR